MQKEYVKLIFVVIILLQKHVEVFQHVQILQLKMNVITYL